MDVSVAMKRAGYRIARRRVAQKKLPQSQRLNKADTMDFVQKRFSVQILEEA
jgi:large subunit ribosomal protein L5